MNRTEPRPEIKLRRRIKPRALLLFFFSSRGDGCNAVRPDASSFSSIKHIWLRAIGGFGFLIHSDFFGGGCGCVKGYW